MKRESGRNREWKEAIEMRGHLEYEREREKKRREGDGVMKNTKKMRII